MHYLALITAELPSLVEDKETNEAVAARIRTLKETDALSTTAPWMKDILLSNCNNMRDTFSRAVNDVTNNLLEPYDCNTENPDYLKFHNETEELEEDYQTSTDCIRFPEGRIVSVDASDIIGRFTIKNGKVYECNIGPFKLEKRTKRAKRMKALPNYPIRKVYSLTEYAEEFHGISFYPEENAYGFYYNPDGIYDWYSIGGRWSDLFLVKKDCTECSIGRRSWLEDEQHHPCPDGYKWVCAARKKDIAWNVMKDWNIASYKKNFQRLQKIFLTGECDSNTYETITKEGIFYGKELIYKKDETEEDFLSRMDVKKDTRYPVFFYNILSDDGWQWLTDIYESSDMKKNQDLWDNAVENYLDSLSDDTVLIGIDYHI